MGGKEKQVTIKHQCSLKTGSVPGAGLGGPENQLENRTEHHPCTRGAQLPEGR